MGDPCGCEICGRRNIERGSLCVRCADILDAGFKPPFKCQQCDGSDDLALFWGGHKPRSILCRSCRKGAMGIAMDHIVRRHPESEG